MLRDEISHVLPIYDMNAMAYGAGHVRIAEDLWPIVRRQIEQGREGGTHNSADAAEAIDSNLSFGDHDG